MKFEELCDARYSLRKFDSRPVEAEKLQKVLEAGRNSDGVINASTPLYTFIALCTFIEKTRTTDANSDPFTHLFFMQVLYPFVRHSSHGFLLYMKSNLGHSKK